MIHFEVVLLLSALVNAPWNDVATAAVLWGIMGVIGVVYSVRVARRLRLQTAYETVFEDRLFHVVLPVTAYAMLALSACATSFHRAAQFVTGAAVLLLLFIGIHNAWDTVTYHVFVKRKEHREAEKQRRTSRFVDRKQRGRYHLLAPCLPRCCRAHTTATFTEWIGSNESKRQLQSSPPSRPIQSWPVVVPK